MKVVQLTKDNATRDRGFIAVDAICSAFENQEQGNVQIMTMDGFWYDVLDDIEKIRDAVVNADVEVALKQEETDEPKSRIRDFYKKYKMPCPAISEKGGTLPTGRKKEETAPIEQKQIVPSFKKHESHRHFRKSKVRFVSPKHSTEILENLPSGDGKGRYDTNPRKAEEFSPPEMVGL